MANNLDESSHLPASLRVITLNCWGLKFLSKHRHARLTEIGHQLATASPAPSIVALQECWTQQDYLTIRKLTQTVLPNGKFYFSGVLGGGLAILSKWPIEESSMYRYPLNGRPAAFFRGDWYVGKGVACARIRLGDGASADQVVEVFCTHLHAPYEQDDSYLCHRTAQAWEIARLMRLAAERGHMVLGLGDFNMVPLSLGHRLVEAHSPVRDVWRILKPDSALGSARHAAEKARGRPVPSARECLVEHGATCDGKLNTWKWSKQLRKELDRGRESEVDPDAPDEGARRLDYVFFYDGGGGKGDRWRVESAEVGMLMRHPTLKCSLSDHFSVEATLVRASGQKTASSSPPSPPMTSPLPSSTYDEVLTLISRYEQRERKQQRLQLTHFWAQTAISIGCFIAVWWSPANYVAFILMLLSTIGFGAGILNGLMGFLFVESELKALKEFEYDIRTARLRAKDGAGSS